jgi:hypothetical protein
LLGARDVGHVVVLDAGQVPREPRDRVRVSVDPVRELVGRQTLDGGVHLFLHAGERVGELFGCVHGPHRTAGRRQDGSRILGA